MGEMDIIAKEKDTLAFIEVKTRTSTSFGPPQLAVDSKKQMQLSKVALYFLKEKGIEDQVLSLVKQRGLTKNVIIVSFIEDALKKIRERDKEVETGLIYSRHKNPIKAALELKANYLLSFYKFTHSANVQKAHENGLKVIVWTVNTPEEVAEYVKKGIDGIATDKPDILKPA